MNQRTASSATMLFLLAPVLGSAEVTLDLAAAPPGPVFEGLGALSAGASSRLLPDYPEPQRSRILDLLFTPKVGAALQHFKVEIGGEVNSTCGTEPSHRRTREESPDFTRGYEWWLMQEARRRNPTIPLDTLCWGAPAWIGGGTYYSQDMADYVADFLAGAKTVHGLDIAYTGIWNERKYDIPWIKRLRQTLDARGLSRVAIVAADACTHQWAIAQDVAKDPELAHAVALLGEHYPGFSSSPEAKATGKRLWAAEDGPWRGDWSGAKQLARVYNRNYVRGGMTKTIIWSLISSYYDNLPLPGSGLMKANTPWSGAYDVQPALWATAHTTQVADPGWRYLGGEACRLLPGGSVVALTAPDGRDLSLVVETMDGTAPVTLAITLPPAFHEREIHPWTTTEGSYFQPGPALKANAGVLTVTCPAQGILSLTTTTGQRAEVPISPPDAPFPSPYRDDFTTTPVGSLGRYLSDQGGIFEVAEDQGRRVLRQQITRKGIEWQPTPEPETFLGDPAWEDQSIRIQARLEPVTADARPEALRFLAVYARVGYLPQKADPAPGYGLRILESGLWELREGRKVLAQGVVPVPGLTWHALGLTARGTRITATYDDRELATVEDAAHPWGQVGFGSGYHHAVFAQLETSGRTPRDLARSAVATASSRWDDQHGPERACDGIAADGLKGPTRWNSGTTPLAEEWLALEFPAAVTCDTLRLVPYEDRGHTLEIQTWDGATWTTVGTTGRIGALPATIRFPAITTRRLRILARSPASSLSFYDVQVFAAGAR